nr:hypothetical protein [Planctomycetota bacterium]
LDGNASFATESAAPFALAGDTAGDYRAWALGAGAHTVTGTPYSAAGATGTAGATSTITFTLVIAPSGTG